MANPEHEEILDFHDKVSVVLYRAGISVFALFLLAYAVVLIAKAGLFVVPDGIRLTILSGLVLGVVFSAANIHVYSKTVRFFIAFPGWIGMFLMITDPLHTRLWLSLGCLFITFSGIALKESFCFQVTGLKFVPFFLAAGAGLMLFELLWQSGVLLLAAGVVLLYLSKEKWQMPLHYDIGDKSRYQV
ncbi:DUF2301 domain-containing membrane protein [Vibrio quintilis]|uniref:Uncharacterized protein n=1 Tax=Vibrio quintilis TaxID=1117707 RepID=A0A1M7YWI6_9VIBR|nr:DUF2301 domain-containing membrane protein [Vibrio quintilis]SHO56883.1 hypothetical protein VQ7734_02652 [Vibrio quintilis]